jgi:hypothetical protein
MAMTDAAIPRTEMPSSQETPVKSADEQVDALSSKEADERVRESLAESQDEILHAEAVPELDAARESSARVPAQGQTPVPVSSRDEVTIEVEKILEEGMGPFFQSLPPEARPVFKQKGEEASVRISDMIRTLKVSVKKVTELILAWLRTIPGVNKYFLAQEAKIKTDRIMELAEARREGRANEV